MNRFILLIGLIAPSIVHAVPVMNENGSQTQTVTLLTDHADPKLFYVAPNVLSLCLDSASTPRFSYQDVSTSSGTHGIVQMTVCPRFLDADLAAAKEAIIARLPDARFVALPYAASRIVFSPALELYVVKEACSHAGGMVGDEQSCSFRLNRQGRRVFLAQVRERLAITMQFEYSVAGFLKQPDGSFVSQLGTYGVSVRVGGDELKNHPELFRDRHGRQITESMTRSNAR